MKHYDRFGNDKNANYSGYSDLGTTNVIGHATDRNLAIVMNGIDTLNFALYLDDPMAAQIKRLESFVKLWRTAPGYADPSNTPCFAGIVASHTKVASENIMRVTAYNPFWRLQLRFHLLNHYLKTDPDTAALYKQSGLIWRLIFFISNAFGPTISNTGIDKGTFYDLANEITMAPYFQPKGANVWSEIFDGILARAGSIDLIPRYHHTSGNSRLMYLDTALKRGTDRSGSLTFDYRVGTPSVLADIVETEEVAPGTGDGTRGFGNYVWAVGAGGPNSGKIAVAQDAGFTGEGYNAIGIYMVRNNYPDVKRIGLGPSAPGGPTDLRANAINDLARAIVPDLRYDAPLSPAANIYYDKDYKVGDVINLQAIKGALVVNNVKQRIYEVGLSMSDNNFETVTTRIAKDFTGKVAP